MPNLKIKRIEIIKESVRKVYSMVPAPSSCHAQMPIGYKESQRAEEDARFARGREQATKTQNMWNLIRTQEEFYSDCTGTPAQPKLLGFEHEERTDFLHSPHDLIKPIEGYRL